MLKYKQEFERLIDIVNQFLANPTSKAALQALKNASRYYTLKRIAKTKRYGDGRL